MHTNSSDQDESIYALPCVVPLEVVDRSSTSLADDAFPQHCLATEVVVAVVAVAGVLVAVVAVAVVEVLAGVVVARLVEVAVPGGAACDGAAEAQRNSAGLPLVKVPP